MVHPAPACIPICCTAARQHMTLCWLRQAAFYCLGVVRLLLCSEQSCDHGKSAAGSALTGWLSGLQHLLALLVRCTTQYRAAGSIMCWEHGICLALVMWRVSSALKGGPCLFPVMYACRPVFPTGKPLCVKSTRLLPSPH